MKSFSLLIAIIGVLDLLATLSAKMWSLNKGFLYLLGTAILFATAGVVFAYSVRLQSMAVANVLWIAVSALLTTIFGLIIFHERVSSLQLVGIVITVIGVIVIALYER